jgi:hypothetical protein
LSKQTSKKERKTTKIRRCFEHHPVAQKGLPFIADKGYDAVDIIESLLDRGFEPAIRIKETMRMSIRHPLRE